MFTMPHHSLPTTQWLGLHHVGIVTHDLDASLAFYVGTLGLAARAVDVSPRTGQRHVLVDAGGGLIHLWEVAGAARPEPTDWRAMVPGTVQHVALRLPGADAVAAMRDRLVAHEVPVSPLQEMDGRSFLLFNDPDGLPVEVTSWLSDV